MPPLLTTQRRERLLEMLERDGALRLDEAAAELEVSTMTVRRDLEELEREGALRRVRGGAVASAAPRSFADRVASRAGAKAEIARKALAVLPHGGALAVDASSTAGTVLTRLEPARELLVATNSVDNLRAVPRRAGLESVLVGGSLDERTGSLVGSLACRVAGSMNYDAFVTSAAGLTAESGTSEATLDEAEVKRVFAANAARVIVVADSSKLDVRATADALAWAQIDALVTELDPSDTRLDGLRELVELY